MSDKTECPACGAVMEYSRKALSKFSVEKKVTCVNSSCKASFVPDKISSKKGAHRSVVKRSQDQERRSAKRNRARAQPGSGAVTGFKGDILDKGRLRGECKFTTRKSFSVKLEELLKIKGEARGGELALFEVEFQGVKPHQRFIVLHDNDYQDMRNELEQLREEVHGDPHD